MDRRKSKSKTFRTVLGYFTTLKTEVIDLFFFQNLIYTVDRIYKLSNGISSFLAYKKNKTSRIDTRFYGLL